MNRAMSLGLLVIGIVLIVFGLNASDSIASEFSEFFSGTPTSETVWFLAGGILLAVLGLFGLAKKSKAL